jgi:hypothetical protein
VRIALLLAALAAAIPLGARAQTATGASGVSTASEPSVTPADAGPNPAGAKLVPPPPVPWRRDPTVQRRPGSYLGGALGYTMSRVWIPANESHDDLALGPLHSWGLNFRVGDAFAEWFALGFQIQITSARSGATQSSAFELLLDATFYPWRGLGIRPSVGIGFGYARGEHEWESGGGGPGCLSMSLLYEIRVTRLFTIAPVVQASWITGDKFDGMIFFAGLEFLKWFRTATG